MHQTRQQHAMDRRTLLLLLLTVILILVWPLGRLGRYQQALSSARTAADSAAAATAVAQLEPYYLADPSDTVLARRLAANLLLIGRDAAARAVLETTFQRVPASQLTALALLERREADGDWAGVNQLLAALQLRPELVQRRLQRAFEQRDWPTVQRWWRRLLQLDGSRAAELLPLAALAAIIERQPQAQSLQLRAQQLVPSLSVQPLRTDAPVLLPLRGWTRIDRDLWAKGVAGSSMSVLPRLGFGRDGLVLVHLIAVPAAGSYRLNMTGLAEVDGTVELRVRIDQQIVATTSVTAGSWRVEIEPLLAPGVVTVWIEALPQNAPDAHLVIETAEFVPQSTP